MHVDHYNIICDPLHADTSRRGNRGQHKVFCCKYVKKSFKLWHTVTHVNPFPLLARYLLPQANPYSRDAICNMLINITFTLHIDFITLLLLLFPAHMMRAMWHAFAFYTALLPASLGTPAKS